MALNKIGEAFVQLSIKGAEKIRATLQGARADTERFAKEGEQGARRLTDAFGKMQETISKLLIPTAIVGAFAGLVNQFKAGIEEARRFREEVEKLRRDSAAAAQRSAAATRSQSELEAEILELRRKQREEAGALQKELDETIRKTSALEEQWKNLQGLFTDEPVTLNEQVEELRRDLEKVNRSYEQQEAAIRAQIRERSALRRQLIEEEIKAEEAARLQRQAAEESDIYKREELLREAARRRTEIELAEIDRRIAEELKREDEKAAELLRRRREQIERALREEEDAIRRATDELGRQLRQAVKDALTQAFDEFRVEQTNTFESINDLKNSIDWLRRSGRLGK